MDKLFEKIDKYEIINRIIPGSLYLMFLDYYFKTNITGQDWFCLLITAYVMGIIMDRLGSLFFSKVVYKIIKNYGVRREYKEYVEACRKDDKIELLVTNKNMYRNLSITFLSMFISIVFGHFIDYFKDFELILILIGLFLLFLLLAYSTAYVGYYISSRIDISRKNKIKSKKL